MACRRVGLPRRRSDPHGPPRPKENMRPRTAIVIAISIALLAFASLEGFTPSGHTRIELTDEGSGTKLLSMVLEDGAPVTLAWRNSQFGLRVTERFHARGGLLIQDRVTFSNPAGPPPPRVSARDVEDLYHTGGAFDAQGLNRPLSRIVYRIGEIGDPKITVKGTTVSLKQAAGFGGRVILETARPRLHEVLFR